MTLRRRRSVLVITVSGAVIAALVWLNRVSVGTWFWHLRHNTVSVGEYIVPVPKNWYPQAEDKNGYLLARLDTDDASKTNRVKAHAGILIMAARPIGDNEARYMAALEASQLEKHGARNVTTRRITLGSETLMCVGGDALGGGIVDAEPESWRCIVAGGLHISVTATHPDMNQVWEIMSGIRKPS